MSAYKSECERDERGDWRGIADQTQNGKQLARNRQLIFRTRWECSGRTRDQDANRSQMVEDKGELPPGRVLLYEFPEVHPCLAPLDHRQSPYALGDAVAKVVRDRRLMGPHKTEDKQTRHTT